MTDIERALARMAAVPVQLPAGTWRRESWDGCPVAVLRDDAGAFLGAMNHEDYEAVRAMRPE